MAVTRTSAVCPVAPSLLIATLVALLTYAAAESKASSIIQVSHDNTTITCSRADHEKKLCGHLVPDEGAHPLSCGTYTTQILGYLPYNWNSYLSHCGPPKQNPASVYYAAVSAIDDSAGLYLYSGTTSYTACTTCSGNHYIYGCSIYVSGYALVFRVTSC